MTAETKTGRPKTIDTPPTNDMELAKRFHEFRTKYISKSQNEAARVLEVSQGYISKVESGLKGIGYSIIEKLITNYQLNSEWFVSGSGPMQLSTEPHKTDLVKDVNALLREIEVMKRTILIMQKNQNHFINLIADKLQAFERMEKFMHEHKK